MTKSEKTGENYQDRRHHSLALRQQEQYIGQLRIGPERSRMAAPRARNAARYSSVR